MKQGHHKTEAVCLDTMGYRDSDVIATLYTSEYGKLKGIARGARKSRKRFVATLEPPSVMDVVFFHSEKADLARLDDSRLVRGFTAVKGDISKFSFACYFLELVNETTREGQANPALYEELTGFLRLLDEDNVEADGALIARLFEIRLLAVSGYMPRLKDCVVCGAAPSDSLRFSSEKGGMICRGCSHGVKGTLKMSAGTAGFLGMAARLDALKLKRLVPAAAVIEEAEGLLHDFIRHIIGKELKTKRFMQSMALSKA